MLCVRTSGRERTLIFIWEGAGGLTVAFYFLGGLIGYGVGGYLGAAVGLGVAGVVTMVVGWFVNIRDQRPEYRNEHTLFYLPMQYWGLFGIAIAVTVLIAGVDGLPTR